MDLVVEHHQHQTHGRQNDPIRSSHFSNRNHLILLVDVLAFFQTTGVGLHASDHHPTTRESSQTINHTQAIDRL